MSEDTHRETERELRERVSREMISDAVFVERDGDTTEISLLYHEPDKRQKLVRTPFGPAIAVVEQDVEALMAELMDDITSVTKPDRMDVEDQNGFYTITLTYEDGRTW